MAPESIPLVGVRVADFTRALWDFSCTMLLADLLRRPSLTRSSIAVDCS
jgi:hypothetical protein